jgi:hypothetical protein
MGEFAQVHQNMEMALTRPGQPVRRGTMAHLHDVYMILADSAVQRRDLTDLRRYAQELETLARRDGHRLYLAIARRAWGVAQMLAGEFDEAAGSLSRAGETFGEYGTRWQIGRTFCEMAELSLAQSDRTKAREYFSRAFEEFDALKAAPDMERTRSALEALE